MNEHTCHWLSYEYLSPFLKIELYRLELLFRDFDNLIKTKGPGNLIYAIFSPYASLCSLAFVGRREIRC